MSEVYPARSAGQLGALAERSGGLTVSKLDQHAHDALLAVLGPVRGEQQRDESCVAWEHRGGLCGRHDGSR